MTMNKLRTTTPTSARLVLHYMIIVRERSCSVVNEKKYNRKAKKYNKKARMKDFLRSKVVKTTLTGRTVMRTDVKIKEASNEDIYKNRF